jgi:putative aminopeptidase FrvX
MEDFVRLLKTLSEARGPSGFEDEVREVVVKEVEPFVGVTPAHVTPSGKEREAP